MKKSGMAASPAEQFRPNFNQHQFVLG